MFSGWCRGNLGKDILGVLPVSMTWVWCDPREEGQWFKSIKYTRQILGPCTTRANVAHFNPKNISIIHLRKYFTSVMKKEQLTLIEHVKS